MYAVLSVGLVAPALVPGKTLSGADILWSSVPWTTSRPATVRPLGSNFQLYDQATEFSVWQDYSRSVLPHIPLWDPYIMAGRPYLANAQAAVLSPFSVPVYVFGLSLGLTLAAALKVFVAAFGTFLLARALGMRFGGALLAGVVYGFNFFLVSMLAWDHSSVWVFLPWLLLLTDRLVKKPDRFAFAGLAGIVGLQFLGGHPESSLHVLIMTGAFFVLRVVQRRRGGLTSPSTGRLVLALAGAVVAGAAVAAALLVPFLELLLHSSDLHYRHGIHLTTEPRILITSFLPEYWGRPSNVLLGSFLNTTAMYVGALSLLLTIVALIVRPTLERLAVLGFAGVALAVMFGTPGISEIARLPGLSSADNRRLVILAAFCFALLAGWGLDDLGKMRGPPRQERVVRYAVLVFLLFPIVLVGIAQPRVWGTSLEVALAISSAPSPLLHDAASTIHFASLLWWLLIAGIGTALIFARMRRAIDGPTFVFVIVALTIVDLFRVGVGINPAISTRDATQPQTGAIRYLESRRPARFAGIGGNTLAPNVSTRYRLYDARGYDFPVDDHFDPFWTKLSLKSEFFGNFEPRDLPPLSSSSTPLGKLAAAQRMRGLSLLSVADLVQAPDAPAPPGRVRLAYSGSDAHVYSNPNALPRAFLVGQQWVVPGGSRALDAVYSTRFDPRTVAVTEHPLAGLPAGGPSASAATSGDAKLTRYDAERVTVTATAARPSLLVLTDSFFPGWKATVDGKSVPIQRVDYLLRGVQLTPGTHRIEFRYQPASWRAGWIISLIAVVGLALSVAGAWRRFPRRRGSSPVGVAS